VLDTGRLNPNRPVNLKDVFVAEFLDKANE